MADRQCVVLVGARGEGFVDEQMARHGADRVEHAFVADPAAGMRTGAQAVDQPVAHALRGHAHADRLGLQSQPGAHATSFKTVARPSTQLATCSSAWKRVRSTWIGVIEM